MAVVTAALVTGAGALVLSEGTSTATVQTLYAAPTATGQATCADETDACLITTAVADLAAGDTIDLAGGDYQAGATLAINTAGSVTIQPDLSAHPVLDGASSYEVMTVASGTSLFLDGVTVENGTCPCAGTGGAGIDNSGSLTVTDSTFEDNAAGSSGWGGAIDTEDGGTLTVSHSTFYDNSAAFGGGIRDDGTAEVLMSTFSDNTASNDTVGGDIHSAASGTIYLAGDLFADAQDACDAYGTNVDDGYNAAAGSTNGCTSGATGDVVDSSVADLGSLSDNGGTTDTLLPSSSNDAIAAISDPTEVTVGVASIPLCPTTDQTGTSNGTSDCTIGAVFVTPGSSGTTGTTTTTSTTTTSTTTTTTSTTTTTTTTTTPSTPSPVTLTPPGASSPTTTLPTTTTTTVPLTTTTTLPLSTTTTLPSTTTTTVPSTGLPSPAGPAGPTGPTSGPGGIHPPGPSPTTTLPNGPAGRTGPVPTVPPTGGGALGGAAGGGAPPIGGTLPAGALPSGGPSGAGAPGAAGSGSSSSPSPGNGTSATGSSASPSTTSTSPSGPASSSPGQGSPSPPPRDLSIDFSAQAGTSIAGTTITATGKGFKPGTIGTLWVHSTPTELGTFTIASNGTFTKSAAIPPDLAAGSHHIIVTGTLRSGQQVAKSEPFTVASGGLLGTVGSIPPGPLADLVAFVPSAHTHTVLASTAGAAAGIGAVAAGLAGGSRSGSGGGRDQEDGGGEGYLEDVELEREDSDLTGRRLHRRRTWQWPATPRVDGYSRSLPARVARLSPVIGRVLVDGDYLRAMFGSLWVLGWLAAAAVGVFAAASESWYALPPALPMFVAIIGLGVLDSTFGYTAGITFMVSALLTGHLTSAPELRVAAGIVLIWFAAPLAAAAVRPLRRELHLSLGVVWDRAADLVIGGLFAAWFVQKMTEALSGLAGAELPISSRAATAAYFTLGFVALRLLIETVAARWYAPRLERVAFEGDLDDAGGLQMALSMVVQVAVFVFVSYPYIGWSWALWAAIVVCWAPLVPWLFADHIPKSEWITRWRPKRLVNWTFIICASALLSLLLDHSVHDSRLLIRLGFVVLVMPLAVTWVLELFDVEEDEEDGEESEPSEEEKLTPDPVGTDSGDGAEAVPSWRIWALRLGGVPLLAVSVWLVVANLSGA